MTTIVLYPLEIALPRGATLEAFREAYEAEGGRVFVLQNLPALPLIAEEDLQVILRVCEERGVACDGAEPVPTRH